MALFHSDHHELGDARSLPAGERRGSATPIWISRRTLRILVALGLTALALLLWRAPTLVALCVGGGGLAVVLSFPVRGLARMMPRSAAIALLLLLVVVVVVVVIAYVVPIVLDQLRAVV